MHLRPIRPDDKAALAAAYGRLSELTRQLRFLSPKDHLSRADLRYLTEVDGRDHVAWVAVDAQDRILAVGRWVRDPLRRDTAEFAIVVGDPFQGRGIGAALAERLAAEARQRGIARFTALVRRDNAPIRHLMRRIAAGLETSHADHGVDEVLLDLAA